MQKRVNMLMKDFIILSKIHRVKMQRKLKTILYQLVTDTETYSLDKAITTHIDPYFVVGGMQSCIKQDAPIICKLIEEGIEDGSFTTTQPALCSEVFLMLLNYWANPILFERNYADTKND